MKSDAHMHPFESARNLDCHAAKDVMRGFVETARQRGFMEISFTEHCPLLPWISEQHFATYVGLALDVIAETREPKIHLGVEMDYHPRLLDKAQALIEQFPFDYVLGSVHIHTGLYREDIDGKTYDDAIALALRHAADAVASGMFDTMAHLDFCRWLNDAKRFGSWPGVYRPELHRDAIMSVLGAMESNGVALEINPSGLQKHFASLMPCAEILEWAAEFDNLQYVFGSDAHRSDSVGRHYEVAVSALSPTQARKLTNIEDHLRWRGNRRGYLDTTRGARENEP